MIGYDSHKILKEYWFKDSICLFCGNKSNITYPDMHMCKECETIIKIKNYTHDINKLFKRLKKFHKL